MKILIVDDDINYLNVLKSLLNSEGYTVYAFTSSAEAFEFIKINSIQVIISDIHMPEINGIELCKMIKKIKPLNIIIANTGMPGVFELAECREAGFDDYFIKMEDFNLLSEKLDEVRKMIKRWRDISKK